MAGGNANDLRTPYPHGGPSASGLVFMQIPMDLVATDTDHAVMSQFVVNFAFTVELATLSAYDVISTGVVTCDLEDDTGTPKVAFSGVVIAAITAGAGMSVDLSPNNTVEFYAGAIMSCIIDTTNAADAVAGGCMYLGLKPLY